MLKRPNRIEVLGLVLAVGAGCASSERSYTKGDPFADPSKFESLASNAYTMPVPVQAATPEPLKEAAAMIVAAPVPAPTPAPESLLDGSSLVSPAIAYRMDYETAAVSRAPAAVRKEEDLPSPETSYTDLIRGNERFVAGLIAAPRRDDKRRREVSVREKPFAVVLSCSDSRTPPELIFDQGLGDLVSIRVPGTVLGSAQVASIEDAVENLGVPLIVVLGHESCSAIKAAFDEPKLKKNVPGRSPDLDWLVTSIRPNLKSRGLATSLPAADAKLRAPASANIDAVTENLLVRSKIVSDAVKKGKLKIVRGIQALDTGRVDFWGMK